MWWWCRTCVSINVDTNTLDWILNKRSGGRQFLKIMLYNIALAFRWPNHPAKRITMGVHNMFSLFLLGLTPARSINYRPKTSEICRIFCTVLLFWSLIIIHEWGVIEKKLEKIRLFDFSTRQKNVVYETSLITIHTGRLYSHMIFFSEQRVWCPVCSLFQCSYMAS